MVYKRKKKKQNVLTEINEQINIIMYLSTSLFENDFGHCEKFGRKKNRIFWKKWKE